MTQEEEKIVGVRCRERACRRSFGVGLPPEAHGSIGGIMCPYCHSMEVAFDSGVNITDSTIIVRRTCYGYGPDPENA
jgi:hypothetical protein